VPSFLTSLDLITSVFVDPSLVVTPLPVWLALRIPLSTSTRTSSLFEAGVKALNTVLAVAFTPSTVTIVTSYLELGAVAKVSVVLTSSIVASAVLSTGLALSVTSFTVTV